MDKQTKDKIKNAMSKLSCTLSSVSHQAICIEAELSGEAIEDNDGQRLEGLNDMWDVNDSDNWTSMEANLTDVMELLKELIKD